VRLRRFSVVGYKNLTQPIVLDDLGTINPIHGANNVGKSNLLQAMALFFRCVQPRVDVVPIRKNHVDLTAETSDLAPDVRSLFNLERPMPILLSGVLDVSLEELAAAGIKGATATRVDVEVTIEWDASKAMALSEVTRFRLGDGTDLAPGSDSDKDWPGTLRLAAFVARNLAAREGPAERFSIVGVYRGLEEDKIRDSAPLAFEMYDCRDSDDRGRRNRWRAFVRAMEQFRDVTGEGAFEVTFPRDKQARLVFDTEAMRIPFRLLGTGVQQAAAVLGHLLMRNATIVAIEEPELNLRWELQDRLRQALQKLVAEPHAVGGVDQIFLTSHSPVFDTGESFLLMEAGPKGPVVSRCPATELFAVLGSAPRHLGLPAPERTPQAYVTGQGVVKLPPHVLERLHLDKGGGVCFLDADPRGVRILTNDDYLDELGLVDGATDADAPP
jgi:AAA domain, putative AbiEii toxin, Type IV TA system